jgi:glycosyltransferase involved in cell wall biosynthesis
VEGELVSVVLCTYNGMEFIGPQLASIQNQSYSPLEIIIADDASTDGTYEWLRVEAEKDTRIRLFKNESNIGFNFNFNKACTFAMGEYIAIADQDDVWELNKLSVLVSAIRQKNDIMLVHCISARFENEGAPHLRSLKLVNYFSGNDVRQFFLSNIISGHNMLLKKELLNASLPFPKEGYYDWWLVVNACCMGRIEAVEEILVWHRIHGSNATGRAKPRVLFYKQTQAFLPCILSIKNMPENYRSFGRELLGHYNELPDKRFSIPLFKFLLNNAPILFAYKKRTFPWISYAKYALRHSRAEFYV